MRHGSDKHADTERLESTPFSVRKVPSEDRDNVGQKGKRLGDGGSGLATETEGTGGLFFSGFTWRNSTCTRATGRKSGTDKVVEDLDATIVGTSVRDIRSVKDMEKGTSWFTQTCLSANSIKHCSDNGMDQTRPRLCTYTHTHSLCLPWQ